MLGDYGGGWRSFFEYGGRKNGDWGAHHFDIIQWALGMDQSGPVEFIPKGWEGTQYQTHVYANGVRVELVNEGLKSMIEFTGTKGTVWVSREDYLVTDPPALAKRPLRPDEIHLYASNDHHDDFLGAIRSRQRTISDVETGHRSATVCHLNNIAARLNRPVRWDPLAQDVVGDTVASTLLDRTRRAPYATLLATAPHDLPPYFESQVSVCRHGANSSGARLRYNGPAGGWQCGCRKTDPFRRHGHVGLLGEPGLGGTAPVGYRRCRPGSPETV